MVDKLLPLAEDVAERGPTALSHEELKRLARQIRAQADFVREVRMESV